MTDAVKTKLSYFKGSLWLAGFLVVYNVIGMLKFPFGKNM